MGLFSRKEKVSVDDMAIKMMVTAVDVVGELKCFNDIDDSRSLVVNMGYFYGFLKLNLITITKLDTANDIINKSIAHMESATKGKMAIDNFGFTVKQIAHKSVDHMKYAKENANDVFVGMATFYILDLQNSNTFDINKLDVAQENMHRLYGITSKLTKDIKIVR